MSLNNRIFDDDDDGCIHAGDLVEVLTNFGEKLTKSEARRLVQKANKKDGGLIDYEGSENFLPFFHAPSEIDIFVHN